MAMVFKSETNRKAIQCSPTGNIGPGEYINPFADQNIKINAKPFNSSSPRSIKLVKNDVIGPGAYYQDETLLRYLKNIQNEKVSKENDKVRVLPRNGTVDLYKNIEKLGFNSKESRFKTIRDNELGPGLYFPSIIPKTTTHHKVKRFKDEEIYNRTKIDFAKKLMHSRIPTIPGKKDKFGFEILEDGNLLKKENPDLYKTFTGEKGDTVGPGTYEIDKPSTWHRTGTEWSKLRTYRGICEKDKDKDKRETTKDDQSLHSTHYSDALSTKNDNFFSERAKTRYIIKDNSRANFTNKLMNLTTGGNDKFLATSPSEGTLKTQQSSINVKKNPMNCRIINCKKANSKKLPPRNNLQYVLLKAEPGPGYYYDSVGMSSFKVKPTPEYKQFFGSRLERFHKQLTYMNDLGPGNYFTDNINYKDIANNPIIKNAKKLRNKTCIGFSMVSDRFPNFKFHNAAQDEPSPASYNLRCFTEDRNKTQSTKPAGKFLSTQSRFYGAYNNKWKLSIPGPGSYDQEETKKEAHVQQRLKSLAKGQLYSPSNEWSYKLLEKSNLPKEVPEKAPPIGVYEPDAIYNIEYNNKKKELESKNHKNVAFNSKLTNKRVKNVKKNEENFLKSKVGPGTYYKEKKRKVVQVQPPFGVTVGGRLENVLLKGEGSPGMYNVDGYYDWNKKSYNVNFV